MMLSSSGLVTGSACSVVPQELTDFNDLVGDFADLIGDLLDDLLGDLSAVADLLVGEFNEMFDTAPVSRLSVDFV